MEKFQLIIKDIYRLKVPFGSGWTGIILVNGVKNKILIDSGASKEHIDNYLIPALNELNLDISDIDYLCCTHCHGDHVGGHTRIKSLANIKVSCYENSADKLLNPMKYSIEIRSIFPEYSPAPPDVLDGVKADILLKDTELLADRLEIVTTPGHDNDCICLFDHETKTLISGDSLQGNGTKSQGIALCMYIQDYIKSLQKLADMDIENIIAGHDYLVTGDIAIGRKQTKEYIIKCRKVVDIYLNYIIKQKITKSGEMINIARGLVEFMGNSEPDYMFLPLYTVKSIIDNWNI